MIKMSPDETGSMISTLHSPIEEKRKRGAYIYITKLVAIMQTMDKLWIQTYHQQRSLIYIESDSHLRFGKLDMQ